MLLLTIVIDIMSCSILFYFGLGLVTVTESLPCHVCVLMELPCQVCVLIEPYYVFVTYPYYVTLLCAHCARIMCVPRVVCAVRVLILRIHYVGFQHTLSHNLVRLLEVRVVVSFPYVGTMV